MNWNGTTIANPGTKGITVTRETIGSHRRTASGSMRVQWVADKHLIQVNWEGLTKAELDAILGIHNTLKGAAATLSLPTNDGRSFSVVSISAPIPQKAFYTGGSSAVPYYDMTINFREA
jgi:hypothetical protein